MKNTIRYRIAIFSLSLLALLTWTPLPFTVTASSFSLSKQSDEHSIIKLDKRKDRLQTLQLEALALYQSMRLEHTGLNEQAFIAAWTGFKNLKEAGKLNNTQVLTICDYSQSSAQKRLYILDIALKKVMVQTYVAHGRNSGLEYATDFSNKPSSYKSSIGFYVTGNSYRGIHGPALNIIGMDQGFNDRASERRIVIHGADYVGNAYLRNKKMIGRSLGCPAVPRKETNRIIQQIKQGSCFFIYHPSVQYFASSTVLNG